MQQLLAIMHTLRGPNGCPWDKAQTHESLRPYLLEEAAEAVDAVHEGDTELCSELGDVLLQVAFHAVIAEERGAFAYADIERGITAKLVRRHPHVFGNVQAHTPDDVYAVWKEAKARERDGQPKPISAQIPASLGALQREHKAQELLGVAAAGAAQAQAEATHAIAKASADAQGVGQALRAVVAWARACNVNPELALRDMTARVLAEAETSVRMDRVAETGTGAEAKAEVADE